MTSSSGRCLLLVEDDDLVRDTVALMLEEAGFEVIEAADATQAIRLIREGVQIEALLTDIDLGIGPSGLELADALHRLRPELRVLFITGRTASLCNRVLGDREAVLPKPFESEALTSVIARLTAPG